MTLDKDKRGRLVLQQNCVVSIVATNTLWMVSVISEVPQRWILRKAERKSVECIVADAGARSQGAMAGSDIVAGVAVPAPSGILTLDGWWLGTLLDKRQGLKLDRHLMIADD